MYKNAGKSIKGIVKTIVVFMMILSIISGIVMCVSMFKLFSVAGIMLGLCFAGMGCFFSWLGGLLLYAYGDLADNVYRIKNAIVEKKQPVTGNREATEARSKGHKWKCASCGTENAMEEYYCVECYASRDWSEAHRDNNR